MDLSDCRMLLTYTEWADATAWKAALHVGDEDGELEEKFYHLHAVQWSYLRIWRGEPVTPPAPDTFASLAALAAWAGGIHADLRSHLAGLSPEALPGEVHFPWADTLVQHFGAARPASWPESVLQVALHTHYHRGQVARRIRELGAEPPLTDLIVWIWMGRPAADWPPQVP